MKALTVAIALMLGASAADADEAISTHAGESPAAETPSAASAGAGVDQSKRQADGDWARRVIAGLPTEEAAQGNDGPVRDSRCPANDGKPHGEAYVSVGTGGYRSVGVAASQPIGDCGEVAVAVSHTEGGLSGLRSRGFGGPRGHR